jgi:hypothetical protein
MDMPLNRMHFWPVVVADAAQLHDLLNEAEHQGYEHDPPFATGEGIVVVLKALITSSNVNLLTKEFAYAKKEKAPAPIPAPRLAVHAEAPLAAAVGKITQSKRGNHRTENKAAAESTRPVAGGPNPGV